MALYRYRALDAEGTLRHGLSGLEHLEALDKHLTQQGWRLLDRRKSKARRTGRRARREALMQFCFHLELGLGAGVTLLECLQDMCADMHTDEFRIVLERMIEAIGQEGSTFSDALQEFPVLFDAGFIGLVRAGESSGSLPAVIHELHGYLQWQDECERRLRNLAAYPLLVLAVVAAAILLLSTWLVPALSSFLDMLGHELPWHTRLLVWLSAMITDWWYLPLMAFAVTAVIVRLVVRRHHDLQVRLDALKLRLPVTGTLLRKLLIARVVTALSTMYGAGLDLLECIRIGAQSTGNLALQGALHQAEMHIHNGAGLAEGFRRAELFPPLVLRMINVGERTGELERCLQQIRYYYNRDIQVSFERLQTFAGPAINVVLGLLLGWVMYSLLGPVYGLAISLAG